MKRLSKAFERTNQYQVDLFGNVTNLLKFSLQSSKINYEIKILIFVPHQKGITKMK